MNRSPQEGLAQWTEARLVAEARALRALARGLLGHLDAADDVVQEAAAAALVAPRAPAGLGPWLHGAVRNLALMVRRTEARRTVRERAAAGAHERTAVGPAELAAQAEVVRDVGAAVHGLDEPFRTVILLRFWRGLGPQAIADELHEPLNTVRSRLQRGLERLRVQLDSHADGRDWRGGLAALVAAPEILPPTVAVAGLVGVLMQTKLLVVAAGLLVAGLSLSHFWPGGVDAPRGTAAVEPRAAAAALAAAPSTAVAPLAQRDAALRSPAAPPVVAVALEQAHIRGRCVTAAGRAIAGVAVVLTVNDAWAASTAVSDTTTTPDGLFAIAVTPVARVGHRLTLRAAGHVGMEVGWTGLEPSRTYDLGDVVLSFGCTVSGLVRDTHGAVPTGLVLALVHQLPATAGEGVLRPAPVAAASVADDGRFAFATPVAAGSWTLSPSSPHEIVDGQRPVVIAEGQREVFVQVVCRSTTAVLAGEVVNAAGMPVALATVRRLERTARGSVSTDAAGRFWLPRSEGDRSDVIAIEVIAAGYERLVQDAVRWGTVDQRLVLQRCSGLVLTAVRDDTGQAVQAYSVRLIDTADRAFGRAFQWQSSPGTRPYGRVHVSEVPRGRLIGWLEPHDSELSPCTFEVVIETTPTESVVRVPRAGGRLLRVVDAEERAVVGTRVELLLPRDGQPVTAATHTVLPQHLSLPGAILLQAGTTGAEGEFVLRGALQTALVVRVLGPGHTPQVVADVRLEEPSAEGAAPLLVRVSRGATVHGMVGPAAALAWLGPAAEDLATAKTLGHLGETMLASRCVRVELRVLGDPSRRYPEDPNAGRVDAAGHYCIDGVPAGSFGVHVSFALPGPARGSGGQLAEAVATLRDLGADEERQLDLDVSAFAGGTLRALVLVDGEPVRSREVQLLYRRPGLRWGAFEVGEVNVPATTDGDGWLTARLAPGTYGVQVGKLRSEDATLLQSGAESAFTFALQTRRLRVRVLRADGSPEVGRKFHPMQERYWGEGVTTDAEGWLLLDPVLPHGFDLVAWPVGLTESKAQTEYIKAHPYPQWLDVLVRLGPVVMPAGESEAKLELRLPR